MAEMLLEARDLHTYYGSSHILHGVSFSIRKGEALGLMGRNGMGKTTLLRTMLGLVRPRHGTVRVNGDDMTRAKPHRIALAITRSKVHSRRPSRPARADISRFSRTVRLLKMPRPSGT